MDKEFVKCPDCNGTGWADDSMFKPCPTCMGFKIVLQPTEKGETNGQS